MNQLGRPKSIENSQNRIHSICLSPYAESIKRRVDLQNQNKRWLTEFIEACLCKGYGSEKAQLITELRMLSKKHSSLESEIEAKRNALERMTVSTEGLVIENDE